MYLDNSFTKYVKYNGFPELFSINKSDNIQWKSSSTSVKLLFVINSFTSPMSQGFTENPLKLWLHKLITSVIGCEAKITFTLSGNLSRDITSTISVSICFIVSLWKLYILPIWSNPSTINTTSSFILLIKTCNSSKSTPYFESLYDSKCGNASIMSLIKFAKNTFIVILSFSYRSSIPV